MSPERAVWSLKCVLKKDVTFAVMQPGQAKAPALGQMFHISQ